MTENDLATLPKDGRWTAGVVYLTEVCAAFGDQQRAAVLYRALLPWSGPNLVPGSGSAIFGSSDRYLGILASTMACWDQADTHFATALAMNERIGGLTALAHTRYDFALMLLARAAPGDHDKAIELIREVRASATGFGLAALARKAAVRLAEVSRAPVAAPDDLTARELEVLRLLAIGRGNADIAMVLEISLNTVATHDRRWCPHFCPCYAAWA